MKVRKVPMRRCVGCMESKPKKELIRLVADEGGSLHVDPTGKANGRGVYLCPSSSCFALARKRKAIGRSLEMSFSEEELDRVFGELVQYEKQDS
ncbi:RNase P modulator RnpM [Bacilliculturomica massiliensis]|uniref:RNase P modulator RnpM n=1 Tax=Bacilliculturomica massiliensis TaxID=1917867 RepID=UPI00103132F9|nr:YlxR family protein [Bacilliculturomica massiliensis]